MLGAFRLFLALLILSCPLHCASAVTTNAGCALDTHSKCCDHSDEPTLGESPIDDDCPNDEDCRCPSCFCHAAVIKADQPDLDPANTLASFLDNHANADISAIIHRPAETLFDLAVCDNRAGMAMRVFLQSFLL